MAELTEKNNLACGLPPSAAHLRLTLGSWCLRAVACTDKLGLCVTNILKLLRLLCPTLSLAGRML